MITLSLARQDPSCDKLPAHCCVLAETVCLSVRRTALHLQCFKCGVLS